MSHNSGEESVWCSECMSFVTVGCISNTCPIPDQELPEDGDYVPLDFSAEQDSLQDEYFQRYILEPEEWGESQRELEEYNRTTEDE